MHLGVTFIPGNSCNLASFLPFSSTVMPKRKKVDISNSKARQTPKIGQCIFTGSAIWVRRSDVAR